MKYTSSNDIQAAYDEVHATFMAGRARSATWRKTQLRQLGLMIQENETAFVDAIRSDLGRPAFETLVAELNPFKGDINDAIESLDRWMKPESIGTHSIWKLTRPKVYSEPKGVVLIIGAWNYPMVLLLSPFIGAIAAGNTAILKPGEQSPATAALISELISRYLDSSAYKVVLGGVEETTQLLKLRFNHIFYTGSGQVGRIIARAAAEHLTPITLELGGKSPAIILDDADIQKTAKRLAWGKWANSGQTCVSPDYILCSRTVQPKLIEAFRQALDEFNHAELEGKDRMGRIVNINHFSRLSSLLRESKGNVVVGGGSDAKTLSIEVTLVADVQGDDSLMQGEIFGPVLPIVVRDSLDSMVEFVRSRDSPLALYVFTSDSKKFSEIRERTRSGAILQNDCMIQVAVPNLPFGGTGESGVGNYHGVRSFRTFSHERSTLHVPWWMEFLIAGRYPPYSDARLKAMLKNVEVSVRKDGGRGGANLVKAVMLVAATTPIHLHKYSHVTVLCLFKHESTRRGWLDTGYAETTPEKEWPRRCRKFKAKCSGTSPCDRCILADQACEFTRCLRGKKPANGKARQQQSVVETATSNPLTVPSWLPVAAAGIPKTSKALQPVTHNDETWDSEILESPTSASEPPCTTRTDQSSQALASSSGAFGPGLSGAPETGLEAFDPLGLLARASLELPTNPPPAESSLLKPDPSEAGIMPSFLRRPRTVHNSASELLTQNLISIAEAEDLFTIYFEHLHQFLPLLSPSIHTMEATRRHSPFLFTSVCTVASRFYRRRYRDDLHSKALKIAKKEAASLLLRASKNLEAVHGFTILCKWHQPTEDMEEDMSYQLSGIAIRFAMDLCLYQSPGAATSALPLHPDRTAWIRSRERAWLVLFVTDRSISVQMGKPQIISGNDDVVGSVREWASASRGLDDAFDRNTAALVELHQLVGHFSTILVADSKGSNHGAHASTMTHSFEHQLKCWERDWILEPFEHFFPGANDSNLPRKRAASALFFYFNYYKVLLYSFGVNRAAKSGGRAELLSFSTASFEAAVRVIQVGRYWQDTGKLCYALDPNFVTLCYVATFLIKFLSPHFMDLIPAEGIRSAVEDVILMLQECSVDTKHSPFLYSKFLRLLMDRQHNLTGDVPISPLEDRPVQSFESGWTTPFNIQDWMNGEECQASVMDSDFSVPFVNQASFWEDLLFPGLTGPLVTLGGPNMLPPHQFTALGIDSSVLD
ncbi:ALDH-like protein [Meredithblackwellia eburnea MCA 4105]